MTIRSEDLSRNRIPISIITGFLGSGKTTLINHLVTQPGMDKTALIINEFGEIGLDNQLVETSIENTLLLENGCICCSIRGDLIDTINDLFAKARNELIPSFSRILIETTGLADPGPIIRSIQNEIGINNRCDLKNVVTLVDGVQGLSQMVKHEEAVVQIAQADIALISKTDLISHPDIKNLTAEVLKINPTLDIESVQHGQIDPDFLFKHSSSHSFKEHAVNHHPHAEHHHHFNHGNVSTCSFVHDEPIDEKKLRSWLQMLFTLRPFAMLRLKGFVHLTNCDQPLLIQAVGNIFSSLDWRDTWPDDKPQTQLVIIFKDLSPTAVKTSFESHVLNNKIT